jgi:hypothetical protein
MSTSEGGVVSLDLGSALMSLVVDVTADVMRLS